MPEKKKLAIKLPKISLKKIKIKRIKLRKIDGRKLFRRAFPILVILTVLASGAVVGIYRAILQNLPDISVLEEFEPSIITYIYAENGEIVGEYAVERRIEIEYADIPDVLKEAIIATEDPRFYKHKGIDFRGILRALKEDVKLILTPRKLQGGSTISQQLARELFLHRKQTIRRKLKEVLLALQIEKQYSKEEILTMYCNQFNLGHHSYGVEAAAQLYFDKSTSELNLAEAAMITGIFRGPSVYSPYRNNEGTLRRRNHVLNRMIEERYLSQEEGDKVKAEDLKVFPLHREDSEFAAYFREEIRKYLYQNYGEEALYGGGLKVYTTLNLAYQEYAEEAVRRQLHVLDKRQGWRPDKENLLEHNVEDLEVLDATFYDEEAKKTWLSSWRNPFIEEGMIIEAVVLSVERSKAMVKIKDYSVELTSKDIDWTETKNLKNLIARGDVIHVKVNSLDEENGALGVSLDQQPLLDGAFLAIEPQTGQIKAMVGGYSFQRSKWNNATQAMRQAGSAIKPLLYTAGLENGLNPSSTFIDEPMEFEDKWSGEIWDPPNYDDKYKGRVTFRKGIEESRNIVTAKMLEHISPQIGVEYCKKFGITSPIYPYLSLSLGAFEVNMVELVSAFTVFPNGGIRIKPYFISRIEDKDGNILEEAKIESEDVISPQVAYIMTSLLQGVVQRGTAQAARWLKKPIGGKTGTTDDWADARFVGFSPSLCAGVWIGFKEGRVQIGERQSGAVAALPAWIDFFSAIIREEKRIAEENDEEVVKEEFPVPSNLSFIEVDRKTGLLPSPVCLPQFIITEVFLPGTEPDRFCSNEDHMMTYDYYEALKRQ